MTATTLSPQDLAMLLLRCASSNICSAVFKQEINADYVLPDLIAQRVVHGVFVTLKREGHLRGCRGVLGQPMPLGNALRQAARQTACNDTRMPAISPTELPYLSVGITLLGPMQSVASSGRDRLKSVDVGRTGLRIMRGGQAGLLLPDVATEMGWDAEQFLEGVCRKAGLPTDAWLANDIQLDIFHGEKISGTIISEHLHGRVLKSPQLVSTADTYRLATLAANNIIALRTGATPTYIHPEMPDCSVEGIVLSVAADPIDNSSTESLEHQHYLKYSFRPGIPLQSSLFELCEAAAQQFTQFGRRARVRVDLTILQDPAHHGTIQNHDLRGYDPEQRALLISANGNNSLIWKPRQTTEGLIATAAAGLGIFPQFAAIHTLSIASTLPHIQVAQTPTCDITDQPRLPAVAGQFYPAADHERIDMVRACLTKAQPMVSSIEKQPSLAIMVPHAGLIYSGAIAAAVWNSIKIPNSILIIGPKHTPLGVNWAVSPHSEWKLSAKTSLMSDMNLTHLISQRVHAMQLDAAAHRREHSIEVELPFIHQLAPNSKIAAITMASADWPHIARAARELSAVLRELPEMPLLVISSDMNHFANDAETRRRDALALDAFASGDPQQLLSVCQQHQISMCGQIPAALVLQTLIELGMPFRIENIAYGTSADISGDRNRVVGYAGSILWPQ